MKPKYPKVTVPLSGEDGNIFFIIARCRHEARRAGVPDAKIEQFTEEVNASPNYDAALQCCMKWFNIE